MADYVRTEKTVKQLRWELSSPTNHVEYAKAHAAAMTMFEQTFGRLPSWDDEIKLVSEDDKIVLWFEVTA